MPRGPAHAGESLIHCDARAVMQVHWACLRSARQLVAFGGTKSQIQTVGNRHCDGDQHCNGDQRCDGDQHCVAPSGDVEC